MTAIWTGSALLVAALLSGCCSGVTTDPRAGGLAGGTCGAMTGAYEARLTDRRSTLGRIAESRDRLERQLAVDTASAGRFEAEADRQQRRLDREQDELARLDRQAERDSADAEAKRQELASIRAEIRTLDLELAGLIRRSSSRESVARALRDGVAVAGNERQAGENPAVAARRQEIERRLAALRRKLQDAGG